MVQSATEQSLLNAVNVIQALATQVGALAALQGEHIQSLKKEVEVLPTTPLFKKGVKWLQALEARGAKFPADVAATFKSTISQKSPGAMINLILDPRIACDVSGWILLFASGDILVTDIITFNVLPGDLTKRWMAYISTDRVWLPLNVDGSNRTFLTNLLLRLQQHFMTIGRLFFRWPATAEPADFLLENDGELVQAADTTKELEGKNIGLRVGPKAARDFFAAWRLKERTTGIACGEAIGKIRMSAATGQGADGQDNGDDDDKPNRKKHRRQSSDSSTKQLPPRKCTRGKNGGPGCGKMHVGDWSTHTCGV